MAEQNSKTLPQNRNAAVALADEELLASLGYKQEFQRAFTGLEVCDFSTTTFQY